MPSNTENADKNCAFFLYPWRLEHECLYVEIDAVHISVNSFNLSTPPNQDSQQNKQTNKQVISCSTQSGFLFRLYLPPLSLRPTRWVQRNPVSKVIL